MKTQTRGIGLAMSLLVAWLALVASARADVMDDVRGLQRQWDVAKYRTQEKDQLKAFEQLSAKADKVVADNPGKAEALIWQGIIKASWAGAQGGLGALDKIKAAKASLEQAIALDPGALEGSAFTTLGSIYYQVPGWPIAFGDDDKARDYLIKAVSMNPNGLDSNFWYGAFLYDQGDYADAKVALEKAKLAPLRDGRELADEGRRKEIDELLVKIAKEL